jgi:hypothetical protein
MDWPGDVLAFFRPLDMAFEASGGAFGYASLIAFLIALGFALPAEFHRARRELRSPESPGGRKGDR